MKHISETLEAGELVCLFPEGRLTRTGDIDAFRPGIERIVRHTPVPVIPLALRGLWGSMFSHKIGPVLRRRPRRFRSRIELVAGEQVPPHQVNAGYLHQRVQRLRGALA
jgi:1-acyl-sn-glycerol-3-phosphate acyltransferase